MHPLASPVLSLLLLATLVAPVEAQDRGHAEARADAQAHATGDSVRSVTHRVVVVNGKTVVDERTENGKPVGRGAVGGPQLPLPGAGAPEDLLRDLEAQMRRQLGEVGGGIPLPSVGTPPKPGAGPGAPAKPPVRGLSRRTATRRA